MTDSKHKIAALRRWETERAKGTLPSQLIEKSGKSKSTYYKHLKDGPPKRVGKPWEALGLSKSTYYYRLNKHAKNVATVQPVTPEPIIIDDEEIDDGARRLNISLRDAYAWKDSGKLIMQNGLWTIRERVTPSFVVVEDTKSDAEKLLASHLAKFVQKPVKADVPKPTSQTVPSYVLAADQYAKAHGL